MSNLSNREKYLIIVIGVLAVIYVYYSFFLSPVMNKIKAEKSKVDVYNTQLKNINAMKTDNKKLSNELDTLKEKNNQNSMALPNFERNPEIPYKLKAMADSNKVSISNINLSQPTAYSQTSSNTPSNNTNNSPQNNTNSSSNMVTAKPGSLLSIPVNLSVTGDYDGIINFISSIEKAERLSVINSINLSSQSTGGSPNSSLNSNITATITLDYFYIAPSSKDKVEYDFNKGNYGKDNPFK